MRSLIGIPALAILLLLVPALSAQADPFTDEPAPFIPKVPRTAEENDALDARSLFAAGRMAEKAERYHDALRLYERALRVDPDALPVLQQVVALAYSLGKTTEALRYVQRLLEVDSTDLAWLRRLGEALIEQQEFEGALKLYSQARDAHEDHHSPVFVELSMRLGDLYRKLGKYEEASENFAVVLRAAEKPEDFKLDEKGIRKIVGNQSRNFEIIGLTFIRGGKVEDALAAFNRAEEARSDKDRHAFHLALVASARTPPQWEVALEHLQKYFEEKGEDGGREAYELFEKALTGLGREKELLTRLDDLQKADPKNRELALFYADALRKAEKWDDARARYQALLDKPGSDRASNIDAAWQGLIAVERATRQASALLDALGGSFEKASATTDLGDEAKAILTDKGLLDELIAAARERRGSEEGLKFPHAHALAMLCLEAKNYEAASEFFDHAFSLEGSTDDSKNGLLILRWALELTDAKKYALAANVLERGIKDRALPSNDYRFYYFLASALELDGRTEEALEAARKAVSISENNPQPAARIPWILYHAKRYDEAEKSYLELLAKLDEEQTAEARFYAREARLMLSNLCVQKKNIPQAEEWLEQVLDEFPEDVSASNDLGYLWADQGKNLERALEMIQRAVASEPDNEAYLDSLGWVYFRLGRNEEAARELEKATAGEEPDPLILDHLGDVYVKLGRQDAARKTYERAAVLFEKQPDAEKLKAVKDKLEKLPAN